MADTRRDKGDGSIRQRPNGSWEGRYSYKDNDGKRITKSVYAPSQNEVKRKLKDMIQDINTLVTEQGIMPSDTLFGEWLDTWMKDYKKGSVRPATYSSYYQNIDRHIRPALGNIELQKIRPQQIQMLLNSLGQKTPKRNALAPWSILKIKNILSGAFEQAVRNQVITFNPVKSAVSPKLEQKEIRILSESEQAKFLDACKGHRLEALYTLALATGMRRGEILALTWDCVDFGTKSITVKSSVSRIKDPDTKTTDLIFSDPKTKAGRRTVPIMESLVPILQDHKARQDAEKAKAGSAWNERNLVFCSNVGTIIEPRRVCTTMDKIADAAGMEHFTFHALRHSFATRMLEANVSPKVVQDILGHADVTLTLNTYSHVMGTTAHEQIAKINKLFVKKEPKPSITKQLAEAKEQLKGVDKSPMKNKNRNGQEL